jgi:hypothetical protein
MRKDEARITLRFHRLFNCDRDSNRCADHGVVSHADQAHHLDVRGHRGRPGKLRIRVIRPMVSVMP